MQCCPQSLVFSVYIFIASQAQDSCSEKGGTDLTSD